MALENGSAHYENGTAHTKANTAVKRLSTASNGSYKAPLELVTFYVGEDSEGFSVHEEFAAHYSPVLREAFSKCAEGDPKTFGLDDTPKRAFQLLVQWLYSQTFELMTEDEYGEGSSLGDDTDSGSQLVLYQARSELGASEDEEEMDDLGAIEDAFKSKQMRLVELWILADKLCIPILQNMVVDEIIRHCNRLNFVATSSLHHIYDKTGSGSQLRRLVTQQCAWELAEEWFEEHPDHFPREMLVDMIVELKRNPQGAMQPVLATNFHLPVDDG
ncbi:hypothetical protein BP5796_10703 [Coleophoma crateriformis]|uniref:BTB domain-containing protein n=1 Tax=Coleophoma crateriformis TaxID=565419 RepID=A0A3D8QR65_9HELO|nr:hypothetical protein BP5796_10703 [Coleophoma crateriformis]